MHCPWPNIPVVPFFLFLTVSQALPGCLILALVMVCTPMASRVVLFVATTLMAVMTVAVTVRAVLASRSSRHQIPSCLFRETHSKALLCSTQGCKPPAKPKHWHWLEHILFSCHFPNSCPSAWMFVCASVLLSGCVSTHFPLCWVTSLYEYAFFLDLLCIWNVPGWFQCSYYGRCTYIKTTHLFRRASHANMYVWAF